MAPKEKKQKLSTSEVVSPSHSEKDMVTLSPSLISKVNVGKAMKKQNDVAMFLAEKVISAVAENSNFVFSPASINVALTMVAASSEEETVRSSILSFLRSNSMDELKAVFSEIATIVLADGSASGGPKISSVNGVWMEQSLGVDDSSLKDLFENLFKATYDLVDFRFKAEEVREEVNDWASRHTNGLIKNILPPGSVTKDTISVFGNALYFKGTWEEKFPKPLTRDLEFHLLNGGSVTVPFMMSHKKQYVEQYKGFKVLKLPFRQSGDIDRQFSMYFYLPNAKDGLNSLVKRVASSTAGGFLESHTPRKQVEVGEFRIPKFKIEFGFEATQAFKGLNLDSLRLYHKALVEIDEDGAEAAAVTVIVCRGGRGFSSGRRIDFVADHPFLFMIREDKTGTVLFVGQIFDPSRSASA